MRKIRQVERNHASAKNITYFHTLGGSIKIKIADGAIQRSIFIVKKDGSIDFSIDQKIAVQELVKVSVLSRRDLGRKSLRCPGIETGTSEWQAAMHNGPKTHTRRT